MILKINGELSRYYAESLVLLFFPGSKFPEDSSLDTDRIEVVLSVSEEKGTVVGKACIKSEEKTSFGEFVLPDDVRVRKTQEMAFKIAAGGAMLKAGEEYTGVFPPWGMITGVRPAKMASDIMNKGSSYEETVELLKKDFLCTPSKAELAALTAKTEGAFITEKARGECSVYVAIPFCPSKCSYCSFVSFTSKRLLSLIPQYLEALMVDIENVFDVISRQKLRVSTVYIGGGTPTVLDVSQLRRLLGTISKCTDVSSLDEFTLEAGRPDTITEEKLAVAKSFGVTRISVNTQTLNDDILHNIGRNHTAKDFFSAYEIAQKSGIKDINVDLIAGLPGESSESFAQSVDAVCSLAPTNITVHTFYAKRSAEIVKNNREVYRLTDLEATLAVEYSQKKLLSEGYLPYYMYRQKNTTANLENVGYSKPGHEGIYNIMMMEEIHTVFGAGASAMTKLVSRDSNNMKIVRICEPKYPYEYLDSQNCMNCNDRRIHLRNETEKFYLQY